MEMKRSKEMKRSRKVLLSLGVLAVVGAFAGAGTFASFFAQTTNPGNVFATGTLVLSDSVDSGTACLSTNGGTTDTNSNSTGCDESFSLTVQKPGDSSTTTLKIENTGSLAASVLKVFSSACTPGDAAGETYHGTGNPCGQVQLYVQQYSNAAFTTPSACLYGGFTGVTCDFSDTTKTLSAFATSHGSLVNGLSAGAMEAAGGTAPVKWFRIGVKLPSTADNTYQGRSATIDLSWNAVQV
jgi:hypothetical protein